MTRHLRTKPKVEDSLRSAPIDLNSLVVDAFHDNDRMIEKHPTTSPNETMIDADSQGVPALSTLDWAGVESTNEGFPALRSSSPVEDRRIQSGDFTMD